MRNPPPSARRLVSAPLLAVALAGLLLGCSAGRQASTPSGSSTSATPNSTSHTGAASGADDDSERHDMNETWKAIERLVDEQKYQAALELAEGFLVEVRNGPDGESWARALLQVVQLETGLHGYERAVRTLSSEPWPEDPVAQTAIRLYYAHGLVTYRRAYSWEVEQRERLVSDEEVDLEAWTGEQIVSEANRVFGEIWSSREALGRHPVGVLERFLTANDYPRSIRGSLRDSVTYLWVELLADTSMWDAREQNEIFLLDLPSLIEGRPAEQIEGRAAVGGDQHPLAEVARVLADLERWHIDRGRPEAALEARLERLRRLRGSFDQTDDLAVLRGEHERLVDVVDAALPWWSVAVAELAELVRGDSGPWSLAEARDIARRGLAAHPDSVGGRRCAHLVASLEAPEYSLTAMEADGFGRRSIEIRHKNLERLFFRAYRIDLAGRLSRGRSDEILPGRREIEGVLAGAAPEFDWAVDLEPTPDLATHRSFATPEISSSGMYMVVSSANEAFTEAGNLLQALYLNVTDLVLMMRQRSETLEVTVRSGSSGDAVGGAVVDLYRYDWGKRGHRRLERLVSGGDGRVEFRGAGRDGAYFAFATLGDDVALDSSARSFFSRPPARTRRSALLYTDRSVYRPGQPVLWKVVAYTGSRQDGRFATLAGRRFRVELLDANGEVVAAESVESNEFGSAAGKFEVPVGRLLGAWRLRASIGGSTWLRVEEYKRPTFEVAVDDPEVELRLNQEARLSGDARYYFGLPVVDGSVAWHVTRVPVYPRWWSWWYPSADRQGQQTVASGTAVLADDGRFDLAFLPVADEREAASGVSYRYRATVEVTDAGGETRSAQRSFRLGFVSVEAVIEEERDFFVAGELPVVSIRRSDLDGTPRAGTGSWRLVVVEQPVEAPLPADLPLSEPPRASGSRSPHRTEGDSQRPRWAGADDPAVFLRSWGDGRELTRGQVRHGQSGLAEIRLPLLAAGVYRLYYETEDSFGARFETQRELVVAASGDTPLAVPVVLWRERASVPVGETARFLVHSGLAEQELVLELFHRDELLERRVLDSADGLAMVEVEVELEHRGGIGARLTGLRDHQLLTRVESVFVPWDDRRLELSFSTFRDRLRPGDSERWSVTVRGADEATLAARSAELLAYMYDRSLDLFAPHDPPDPLALYPVLGRPVPASATVGSSHPRWRQGQLVELPAYPHLSPDRLRFFSGYGIGGMGRRRMVRPGVRFEAMAAEAPAAVAQGRVDEGAEEKIVVAADADVPEAVDDPSGAQEAGALRSEFAETAFWEPHLQLDDEGSVSFEFSVPDSLTEWNIWVHAITSDLKSGRLSERAVTAKELMVRPYLPRFLREGDRVEVQVMVSNAGDAELEGSLDFALGDAADGSDLAAEFELSSDATTAVAFRLQPGESKSFPVMLAVPSRLGEVVVTAHARAGDWQDGERRLLPLLPGRMHLMQSRFAALRDEDRRQLVFDDMAERDDPTRIDEQLVVTVDAQLFYGVLQALPYLARYPYECTEQTLNRFLSTAIVSSVYEEHPLVREMAKNVSGRGTRLEPWLPDDPNRRMGLEETPWLSISRGGSDDDDGLIDVLNPRTARREQRAALAKLEKAQTRSGGFPWWPGGPPSPYMTLYLLSGFSRALEFGVEVPKPMVEKAWAYAHRHYLDEMVRRMTEEDCCWELVTFLNYVLSAYPDDSWTGGVFAADDRRRMLDFSFGHWKAHAPLLKGFLALTLERAGRSEEARLVFDSIMDSAKSDRDLGTYWAPEEKSWLWYNDTIETHAFALRALTELAPDDERRHGLVQWLFLNKQLNHWKSTRATGEVIYALVHYLEREGTLGAREAVRVTVGDRRPVEMTFEPEEYSGGGRQVMVSGADVEPQRDGVIVVDKQTPGLAFASATWHFSTEELPAEASGDFFSVRRRYFRRYLEGEAWALEAIGPGDTLESGDQVEVQLEIRAKHAAEYVHLRDPRPAGFEPERLTSGYSWNLGIAWYEETRDSGTNFFVEWLPAGRYTLRYRLRAQLAGSYRSAPAQLQSMYAPEFAAYSAGSVLQIANE